MDSYEGNGLAIYSLEELRKAVEEAKRAGRTAGLCHGCFDVLHTGHLRHFSYARTKCDELYISVTADKFVNKGADRPVFPDVERAELIAGLKVVSAAYINEAATALELLKAVRPSIYFKGQEYLENPEQVNPNFIEERDLAISLGIDVQHTFEKVDSSSRIIRKIRGE